jgi:hypothetical protein
MRGRSAMNGYHSKPRRLAHSFALAMAMRIAIPSSYSLFQQRVGDVDGTGAGKCSMERGKWGSVQGNAVRSRVARQL